MSNADSDAAFDETQEERISELTSQVSERLLHDVSVRRYGGAYIGVLGGAEHGARGVARGKKKEGGTSFLN